MNRTLRNSLALAALALVESVTEAHAQTAATPIYNFQFESSDFFGTFAPTDYSGTGALGYGGTTFNHIVLPSFTNAPTITQNNAVDSFGAASTVGLSVTSPTFNQYPYSSGPAGPSDPQTLLSQYLYNGGNPDINTFTLTNLPALSAYKLYLYGGDGYNESKGTLFTVTGGVADGGLATTTAAQVTSFAQGVNYVLFTGITDATGTVQGTYQPTGGIGAFNGLQINVASPSSVPEPGSVAFLAGLSVTGTALLSRHRLARK